MTSTIIGLLFGAGLTFGANAILQLVIVPRVETRKRREDRWEKDVLALGDLLNVDLPKLARVAEQGQYVLHFMNSTLRGMEGVDDKRIDAAIPERERAVKEATAAYVDMVKVHASWLLERIVSIAPDARVILRLQIAWVTYEMMVTICSIYDNHCAEYDPERFEQEWNEERMRAENLRKVVRELALTSRPPRQPLLQGSRNAFSTSLRRLRKGK